MSQLNVFRTISLIAAVMWPGYWILLPNDVVDPFWLRCVFSALFLFLVVGSYFSEKIADHITLLFHGVTALAVIWLGGILWVNRFLPEYSASYLVLTFGAGIIFEDSKKLLLFITLSFVVILIAAFTAVDPVFDPFILLGLLGGVMTISYISRGVRLKEKSILVANSEIQGMIKEAAFDTNYHGIMVVNQQGKIIERNTAFNDIFMLPKSVIHSVEADASILAAMELAKDPEQLVKWVDHGRDNPESETLDILELKDGRYIERFSKPLKLRGEIKGRLWFFADITEQKNRIVELTKRNFELDSFVYRASHDIKAPLNSIMGLIEIIQQEKNSDQFLLYTELMSRSTTKLNEFIKELVHFSQVSKLNVVREVIDLDSLIGDILANLKFMEGADKLDVKIDLQLDALLYSDPLRLEIVLSNLISNVIKYQDKKKPQSYLHIKANVVDEHATVEIKDNGIGIPDEHQERIFELFFRASSQSFGSGLGLYNVINAVQKIGGKIELDSKPGEGTTFMLDIPNQSSEL